MNDDHHGPTCQPDSCRSRINLAAFCSPSHESGRKYDYTSAIIQAIGSELHAYATDSKICIRIPAIDSADATIRHRMPPVHRMNWCHATLGGWRPWPEKQYIEADDSECPKCNGSGTATGRPGKDCPGCEGFGCDECGGQGFVGERCPECEGCTIGIHASIQPIGDQYIEAKYEAKIREHLTGVEYVVIPSGGELYSETTIAFRFAGGEGLLMPIDKASAEARIADAARFNKTIKSGGGYVMPCTESDL